MSKQTIRIRKYPNRRLYDTSRSAFITANQLFTIVREGQQIEVIDSATKADITNIVLLNILIDLDPARVSAMSSSVLHAVANGAGELSHAAVERGSEVDRLHKELASAKSELDTLKSRCAAKAS